MKTVLEQLADFIKDADRSPMFHGGLNRWLEDDQMQVYVRKSKRLINDEWMITLDLANAEVFDKGKGTYTKFVEAAHSQNPWDATYCENTLNERLAAKRRREGDWYEIDSGGVPSFWKPTRKG